MDNMMITESAADAQTVAGRGLVKAPTLARQVTLVTPINTKGTGATVPKGILPLPGKTILRAIPAVGVMIPALIIPNVPVAIPTEFAMVVAVA